MEGRGRDPWEPQYVGVSGYVTAYSDEEREIQKHYTETPWQVTTYERDKQFLNKSEQTIDHKTPVIVREQLLEVERYNFYHGHLRVERISDGAQFYINVRNFVTEAYWNKRDSEAAVREGYILAEYHQRSNYWPVNFDNKKSVPPEGTIFFATGRYVSGGQAVSDRQQQIEAYNSDYGWIFFNRPDLDVVY